MSSLPHLLQIAYYDRLSRNSRYSLRSFARSLALSPAFLCEVLKGKKSLSYRTARHVATLLYESEEERESFLKAIYSRPRLNPSQGGSQTRMSYAAIIPEALFYDLNRLLSEWFQAHKVDLGRKPISSLRVLVYLVAAKEK